MENIFFFYFHQNLHFCNKLILMAMENLAWFKFSFKFWFLQQTNLIYILGDGRHQWDLLHDFPGDYSYDYDDDEDDDYDWWWLLMMMTMVMIFYDWW